MRSRYATINTICGLLSQMVLAIINLVIRKVMIQTIGADYLGVNGLFSNIISLLCLAESGFGIAIVFSLYRPIAEDNQEQISKLVNYFASIYRKIAGVVFLLGVLCIPLLRYVVKDNPFSERDTIIFFILFLLNNCSSYLFAYKSSFMMASQKQYIVNIATTVANILFTVLRIWVLIVERNYIVFLILIILNTLVINISVAIICNYKYSYLVKNRTLRLEKESREDIWSNVKALMWHKIGTYVLNGTDYLVISSFIGLGAVAIYSNYLTITALFSTLITQFFNAVTPAMGDIIAEDEVKHTSKAYETFRTINYISFILYSVGTMFIVTVLQTFIGDVWIGKEYLLPLSTVLLIATNFYLGGTRMAITAVKRAAGIYKQDKFSPVCESVINLLISIILVRLLGVAGVVIGTITALICMPFWTAPFYVYRDLFKVKFNMYLRDSLRFMIFTVVGCLISYIVISKIAIVGLEGFIIKTVIQSVIALLFICIVTIICPEGKSLYTYWNKIKRWIHIS